VGQRVRLGAKVRKLQNAHLTGARRYLKQSSKPTVPEGNLE
jgi:hypothetical protein